LVAAVVGCRPAAARTSDRHARAAGSWSRHGALSPVGDVLESELVAVGYREQPVQPCSGRGGRGFTEPAMESESGTRLTADSDSTFEIVLLEYRFRQL
jgi:hypothetical protein